MFAEEVIGTVGDVPVQVVMTYDEADPWTIMFTFVTADGLTDWEFSRELLGEALDSGSSGLPGGDVEFAVDVDRLAMTLRSNRGAETTVHFPLNYIINFMQGVEARVPTGSESLAIDIQAEWDGWVTDES